MATHYVRSATPPTAKCKSKDQEKCEFESLGIIRINQSVKRTWRCKHDGCHRVVRC